MPMRIIAMIGLLAGLVVPVAAQDSPDRGRSAGAGDAPASEGEGGAPRAAAAIFDKADRIQYVGPDTYILLDAEGRPQPVPGITYEDFLAAWMQLQQPAAAQRGRRYSIESINVVGKAGDSHAKLKFTAQVRLLADESMEVPLGLLGAILDGEPRFATPTGDQAERTSADEGSRQGVQPAEYLYFHPQRGGFVVHLEGRSGDRREISLDVIVPLIRDGTQTTLPLNCPRATSSSLSLIFDKPVGNAIVNTGTLVAAERTAEGGVRLEVAGATGSVRLAWQAGDAAGGDVAAVLGAAGAIRVAIDGRSVRSDVRLAVESYGGSFDRFQVRLPPGAQLIREKPALADTPGHAERITVEDETPSARTTGGTPLGQLVLVQLPSKQQGRTIVQLATEQPIGLVDGRPRVELGAFEVLGAVRQFGDVAVYVAGDWQGRWVMGDHVRQVDPSELDESLQLEELTAAFQYDQQPWSLGVRIMPRQLRVHVAPKYEMEVLPDEARLTVHLAYQVFGTRAFEFQVALNGWEVTEDPVDSGGLVDQDRIQVAPDGTLALPLAQSSSGRAEITFTARRPLRRDQPRFELPLPVPIADAVGTGELVVTGAADVELLPDPAASSGLTATPVTEASDAVPGKEGTKHHFRTSLPEAVFVAERLHRAREVSVKAAAQLELQETEARIEQNFEYAVRYEPIQDLHFEIPPALEFDLEQTEIALVPFSAGKESASEGRETPLSFVTMDAERDASSGGRGQLRVALPQPRLGQFAIRVRYKLRPPGGAWNGTAWLAPLFQQADGRTISQTALTRSPPTLAAALNTAETGSTWKLVQLVTEGIAAGSQSRDSRYVAARPEAALPLLISTVDPNLPSSTLVDRMWLQTWLSGDTRQDRAAFRFRTLASQTTVELPPQAPPDEVEVLVDGRPAEVLSRGTGRITVRPPSGGNSDDRDAWHTLELRYRQPAGRGIVRRHRFTPPQIVGTTLLSDAYWQIVLPGDRHIVRAPERMTAASRWQWLGSFFGSRGVRSQADLEKWAGATAQLAPVAADNQYLFTGMAPVATIEVITAPRWVIVLAASSAVLLVLAAWTYVPRTQRGWLLVGIALVIACLALAYPGPALLLAQAAVLGVAAAAISLLIARFGRRRPAWPVTLSGGSSQRQLTPRADSMVMPPLATASTAPTAPLGVPESER
jgi:hypothetical protein